VKLSLYCDVISSISLTAYLHPEVLNEKVDSVIEKMRSYPEIRSAKYISREEAAELWEKEGGADFNEFLKTSVLPASIEFTLNKEFAYPENFEKIKRKIEDEFWMEVDEVNYPKSGLSMLSDKFYFFYFKS
jgi:cell division transport system permease protein